MPSLNRVFLAGNLTRDPDARRTPSGTAVCKLGLAVNRTWRDANGDSKDEVTFVDIEVWGRQAESCRDYLRKGAAVLVEGRLRLDQWEDRESQQKRSKLVVVGERVQFLSVPQGRDGGEQGSFDDTSPDDEGDDIPF